MPEAVGSIPPRIIYFTIGARMPYFHCQIMMCVSESSIGYPVHRVKRILWITFAGLSPVTVLPGQEDNVCRPFNLKKERNTVNEKRSIQCCYCGKEARIALFSNGNRYCNTECRTYHATIGSPPQNEEASPPKDALARQPFCVADE